MDRIMMISEITPRRARLLMAASTVAVVVVAKPVPGHIVGEVVARKRLPAAAKKWAEKSPLAGCLRVVDLRDIGFSGE